MTKKFPLNQQLYKVYQLSEVFINKYSFKQVVNQNDLGYVNDEVWLVNLNSKYQIIRITTLEINDFDLDRLSKTIAFFNDINDDTLKFLDIHISNEKYDESLSPYDYLYMDDNYADGRDLHDIYPDIYGVIKKQDNPADELININKRLLDRKQNNLNHKKPILTYLIIAICTIMFLLIQYLSFEYSMSSIYVVFGGDYLTFTLGLKQLYRLLTTSFIHGSFIHLLTNMYSLLHLGSYIELKYGKLKYLLVLFGSVLIGSLTQDILSSNTITVGISAGIYGLLIIYMSDMIRLRFINLSQILSLIFVNLMINFMAYTAYFAHLGGLVSGYIFYLIYKNEENKGYIALLIITIAVLLFKFLTIKTINPLYIGTDNEVLKILNDYGFNNLVSDLFNKLNKVYYKYGG